MHHTMVKIANKISILKIFKCNYIINFYSIELLYH